MTAGNRIDALIDGEEIFQSLYSDIRAVDREGFIYLAFWMLDPGMTIDVRSGQTMGELIAQKAGEGVKIRILIWDYYTILAEQVLRGRSQILPRAALPAFGGFIRLIIGPHISENLWRRFLQYRFVTADNVLQLVRHLRSRRPRPDIEVCLAPFPDPTMPSGPARVLGLDIGCHHQKTAIINLPGRSGRRLRVYVLGTNLHDDYHDNQYHCIDYPQAGNSLRARPLHDAGVVAEGPIANGVEAEFIRRWELQRQNYPGLTAIQPSAIIQPFSPGINCELLITAPTPPHNDIRSALLDDLRQAQTSVYIEDQYFFNLELTEALTDAALSTEAAGRRLNICLLTNRPNEFESHGIDIPMELFRFVNFTNLQLATCEGVHVPGSTSLTPHLVRRDTGERWSLSPASGDQRWNLPKLQIVRQHGNPIRLRDVIRIVGGVRPAYALSSDDISQSIYIHSKLTIIDDRIAFIGSANYSVRSMEYDSEASLRIDDLSFAGDLRMQLFEEMTGREYSTHLSEEQAFTFWNESARRNALMRNIDGARLVGNNVILIQYPPGFANFLDLRRRIARELSRVDSTFLRLLARFIGCGSLKARLTDAQLVRLLEMLYPLH